VVATALAVLFLSTVCWEAARGRDLTNPANLVTVAGSVGSTLALVFSWSRPPVADIDAVEKNRATISRLLLTRYRKERTALLGRDFKVIDVAFVLTLEAGRNAEGALDGGSFAQVTEYFRALRPRRMVITGVGGSGKTMLALELALRLLENPRDGEPIPFMASVARWDTSSSLAAWLAEEIFQATGVPAVAAAQLLDEGLILPVLDGLDEMTHEGDSGRRPVAALARLNRETVGEPLILTCRSAAYDDLRTAGSRLVDCARITLRGVLPDQAGDYLGSRAHNSEAWLPVLDDIRTAPTGTLGSTLNTPWLLTMTSTVAEAEGDIRFLVPFLGRPAEPISLSALEHALFTRYIRSTIDLHGAPGGPGYDDIQVQRWSAQIAGFLASTAGRDVGGRRMSGREIVPHDLWPIAGTRLPRVVTAILTVLLWVPVVVTLSLCMQRQGYFPLPAFGILLLLALLPAASVAVGLTYWPQPRRIIPANLVTARGMERLGWGSLLGLVLGANAAALFPARIGWTYGLGFAVVFGPGLATAVRGDIQIRGTLVTAFTIGLLAGAVSGAVLRHFDAFAGLVAGLGGGALALVAGVQTGITLARRNGGGRPDLDEPGLPTPGSPVRRDLQAGVTAGTITGALAFLVTWRASWVAASLPLACATGLSAFLAAGPGFVSSVSRRYAAMLLCTRGQLPLRLHRFLGWASEAGILRVASTAYEFRHDRLLRWLQQ
jgi:hypothetical protein